MEEEASSWIRRAKFSHTVCHRLDSSKLASFDSFNYRLDRDAKLKSRPEEGVHHHQRSAPTERVQLQRNPATNKQRSASPLPETFVPDTFREAQNDKKRFTTPHPRGRDSEKEFPGKSYAKNAKGVRPSKSYAKLSYMSASMKQFSPVKPSEKAKGRKGKDSSWSKYFDHGGGRVTAVEAADEHMVDLSELFLGLRFAHGAHSRLYHGMYKDEPVAVKIIRIPDDDENGDLGVRLEKQFNREVTLLSRLSHQNVIRFVAACRDPPVFCIITEYLSEGSLRAYLHKLERKSLPMEKVVAIALDIARGMEYIHSEGVIHRDLKPENVLISEDFHMKLVDFGIACEEAYCDSLTDDPGTFRWMAPEMIKRKSYGRKVDMYSFGLILWEMVAGSIPYEDMTPIQAAFAVVNKNLRPVIPIDCPPAMRALIEQCWSSNPDKRPEFWQVVKVLEQFSSLLDKEGTLALVQNLTCQDHKKGLLHWIQKLSPAHPSGSFVPKPKFH